MILFIYYPLIKILLLTYLYGTFNEDLLIFRIDFPFRNFCQLFDYLEAKLVHLQSL